MRKIFFTVATLILLAACGKKSSDSTSNQDIDDQYITLKADGLDYGKFGTHLVNGSTVPYTANNGTATAAPIVAFVDSYLVVNGGNHHDGAAQRDLLFNFKVTAKNTGVGTYAFLPTDPNNQLTIVVYNADATVALSYQEYEKVRTGSSTSCIVSSAAKKASATFTFTKWDVANSNDVTIEGSFSGTLFEDAVSATNCANTPGRTFEGSIYIRHKHVVI
ncbi:MAG: hypothetical protein U0T84_01460 [Chitinophagales bacterium]